MSISKKQGLVWAGMEPFEVSISNKEVFSLDKPLVIRGWRTPSRGRPLVHFLHGNGFCAGVYRQFLSPLFCDTEDQQAPFDGILTDLQGHGLSDSGERFLGWNANADIAGAVMDHFLPEYPDVERFGLGHSFGGVLTALLSSRRPELFSRTLLLDPVLFSPLMIAIVRLQKIFMPWHRLDFSAKALKRRSTWASRGEAKAALNGRGIYRDWTDACLQDFVDAALVDVNDGVTLACPAWLEAEVFNTMPLGLWKAIRRSKTPTHNVYGRSSYPFVSKSAASAARKSDQFSAESVEGGHCFMHEAPELATSKVIETFIKPAG